MKPIKALRVRRFVAPLLIALSLGGVALGAHSAFAHKLPDVHYETAPVERGDVKARVTATGTLSALVTVQVGTQISGRVSKLFVDFNSPVKKGQVLAVIDPEMFQAAVEQQQANVVAAVGGLAKSKAELANTKLSLDRQELLAKEGLVAQADVDTAHAAYDTAKADIQASQGAVSQAQASLHQAAINLAYTKIVSPVDGTVISRSVDVGQTVAAALAAPTLFTIAQDLKAMQVDTSVAEGDVGKLQPGMKTSFTVDAYPGDHFEGTVREIRNAATTLQNVVTYDAVIDVTNADLKLRPGMTANVTFTYAEADGALLVPNAALRYHPASDAPKVGQQTGSPDSKAVYVVRNGAAVRVQVDTGITDGSQTELKTTLAEGDRVIVDGGDGAAKGGAAASSSMRGMGKVF